MIYTKFYKKLRMSLTKYLLHYKSTLIDNIMKKCQIEY